MLGVAGFLTAQREQHGIALAAVGPAVGVLTVIVLAVAPGLFDPMRGMMAPPKRAETPERIVIPLSKATRTKPVSSSTVRVTRAPRARRVRAARAKSLPAGEKTMVGWDGIEPPTPGFSVLCSTN